MGRESEIVLPPAQDIRWHVFPDEAAWLEPAVQIITTAARDSIQARGAFNIALAGGGTPLSLYDRLCKQPAEWSRWHIYFGDEHCLPSSDPGRHSALVLQRWLSHTSVPQRQIHPIPAELGASEGASRYAETLADVDLFDLVLLGLGNDGHTASLFPGHDWGGAPESPSVLAVQDAPIPPPERVSLSARRLSLARRVLFLVAGATKRDAVARWRSGAAMPPRAVVPPCGVDVFVDAAAFGT
jgi:6-phosphogluconolactonase